MGVMFSTCSFIYTQTGALILYRISFFPLKVYILFQFISCEYKASLPFPLFNVSCLLLKIAEKQGAACPAFL